MHKPIYTREEERLNYATHGMAAVLAIIGLIHLIDRSLKHDDHYLLIAMIAFGGSLVLTFMTSAIYHWVEKPEYKKHWFYFCQPVI